MLPGGVGAHERRWSRARQAFSGWSVASFRCVGFNLLDLAIGEVSGDVDDGRAVDADVAQGVVVEAGQRTDVRLNRIRRWIAAPVPANMRAIPRPA